MEGDDAAAIKSATEELAKTSHKLAAENLYQQQAQEQPQGNAGGAASGSADGDDVVDADFTEVKK